MPPPNYQAPVANQAAKRKLDSYLPKCPKCNAHGHSFGDCFLENPQALELYLQENPRSEKYWHRKIERHKAPKSPKYQITPKQILKRPETHLAVPGSKTQLHGSPTGVPKNTEVASWGGNQQRIPAYHEGLGLSWGQQFEQDKAKHARILKWVHGVETTKDSFPDAEQRRENGLDGTVEVMESKNE